MSSELYINVKGKAVPLDIGGSGGGITDAELEAKINGAVDGVITEKIESGEIGEGAVTGLIEGKVEAVIAGKIESGEIGGEALGGMVDSKVEEVISQKIESGEIGGSGYDDTALRNALRGHVEDRDAHGFASQMDSKIEAAIEAKIESGELGGGVASDHVARPSIIVPADGAQIVARYSVWAASSAFSMLEGEDSHEKSDWQLFADSSASQLISEDLDTKDLETHSFTGLDLGAGQLCYARCRHHGYQYGKSKWSALVSFLTVEGITQRGFQLARHESGMGTKLGFYDWQNRWRYMVVLDAQYRNVLPFGLMDMEITELTDFPARNASDNVFLCGGEEQMDPNAPLPEKVTNKLIYEQWGNSLASDKTAKANCDVWIKYKDHEDSIYNIQGVPAVEWCRKQTLDGQPCDLPNIFEAMCIYACGEILDEMDPSAAAYPNLKLGYTATGKAGQGRRQSNDNGDVSSHIWSSTRVVAAHYPHQYVRAVSSNSACTYQRRYVPSTAVPILEL